MGTTCVSGFWPVNNKHGEKYAQWFQTSLKINCPYVFFCEKETVPLIQKYRKNLPTVYVECALLDFVTWKYKDKIKTHPIHCPSVELNLIWNEKLFLIQKAARLNPFSSEFFCWVDAGICLYRDKAPPTTPFPNPKKTIELPKNKFVFSSSGPYDEKNVTTTKYWHHVSATSFIMHKSIVDRFALLYSAYLDNLLDHANIWTDQVVLTHVFKDNKQLFFELCTGYGQLLADLY
jgi:hypothetical protein